MPYTSLSARSHNASMISLQPAILFSIAEGEAAPPGQLRNCGTEDAAMYSILVCATGNGGICPRQKQPDRCDSDCRILQTPRRGRSSRTMRWQECDWPSSQT